jgi:anti-sigma regulatory factor (Ser/Thr protein kinase)
MRHHVGPAIECPYCECLVSLADVTRPGEKASRTVTCRGCAGIVRLAATHRGLRTLSTLLPPIASSARAARAFTLQTTNSWGYGSLSDDATLIVSELVTNALTHSFGPVLLSLAADVNGLGIEVRDDSPQRPLARGGSSTDENFRGLMLVAATADEWGVTMAGLGKVVWAHLTVHSAAHSRSRLPPVTVAHRPDA